MGLGSKPLLTARRRRARIGGPPVVVVVARAPAFLGRLRATAPVTRRIAWLVSLARPSGAVSLVRLGGPALFARRIRRRALRVVSLPRVALDKPTADIAHRRVVDRGHQLARDEVRRALAAASSVEREGHCRGCADGNQQQEVADLAEIHLWAGHKILSLSLEGVFCENENEGKAGGVDKVGLL